MGRYLRVFNFLWRLKRVEHVLSAGWHLMKPGRVLQSRRHAPGSAELELMTELTRCHTLRHEMSHFCTNLQYYVMFEVLETSWDQLQDAFRKAKNLDALIAAHDAYLTAVMEKALLGVRSQPLAKQLAQMFDLILRFHAFSARLVEAMEGAAARRQLAAAAAERRTAQGQWGFAGGDDSAAVPPGFVERVRGELDGIMREYSALFEGFVALIAAQKVVDLRSLIFRLDFSEFYKTMHAQGVDGMDGMPNPGQ